MDSSTFKLMPAPADRRFSRRALGKSRSKTRKSRAPMQRKRGSTLITPSCGDTNPENWVDTKRRRLDKHNFIGSVVEADRALETVTEANMFEGVDEDLSQGDAGSEGPRFYRNTDLWLVGEFSNRLAYSGALTYNSTFATEQMKTRLAQLEQQTSFKLEPTCVVENHVKKTETGQGLLTALVSAFQRITAGLPFFG